MRLLFLISGNFIFYITFVQFGLLRMTGERFGLSVNSLGVPLGLMAVTGAASSVIAGYLLDRYSPPLRKVFNAACVISVIEGVAAISSINIHYQGFLTPMFSALGLLMGVNGVLIIRTIDAWPEERRGTMAGWAMALVYLVANIIAGFVTIPDKVAFINGLLTIGTGLFCISSNSAIRICISVDSRRIQLSFLNAVLILATFVALDSFVFHLETNMKELYHYTWEGRWLWNGLVHAMSAVAAGFVRDRMGERPVFAWIFLAFALSFFIMVLFPVGSLTGFVSTLFYNTAVSFYGILLIIIWFYADSRMGVGLRIGIGMGIAGWLASPLGIAAAMAMMPGPVPLLFTGPLVIIMFLSFALLRKI